MREFFVKRSLIDDLAIFFRNLIQQLCRERRRCSAESWFKSGVFDMILTVPESSY